MKREKNSLCIQSEQFYYDFLMGQKDDISQELSKHISGCEVCRIEIERLRHSLEQPSENPQVKIDAIALHAKFLNQWITCNIARSFFAALCHPELSLSTLTPITAHVKNCPLCQANLVKIEKANLNNKQLAELNSRLNCHPSETTSDSVSKLAESILKSDNSGIQTRMILTSEGLPEAQVLKPQKTKTAQIISAPMFVKAAMAASIVLAASLFLFYTSSASGVSLYDVYQAVTKLSNCHIESIAPEQEQIIQNVWISKKMQVFLYQQQDSSVLWDIAQKKALYPGGLQNNLSNTNLQFFISKLSDNHFGLLPFENLRDLPADYSWKRNDSLSNSNLDVYDLTWQVILGNNSIQKMWRAYLNRNTYLPARIEWIDLFPNQQPVTVTTMIISYPETKDVINVIKEIYPDYRLQGAQEE